MSRSPQSSSPEPSTNAYLAAWRAAGRLLDEGKSWSGRERNCAYLNCGNDPSDPRFANVSAASGLDFMDDGRGLAVVDWDQDGDLDLWLSNRTAPRLRFMRNDTPSGSQFVALRLRGTTCNRDAVGARVEVELSEPGPKRSGALKPLIQTVRAGDGFLAQSSKWLHFGLGPGEIRKVTVRWPAGQPESFTNISSGRRYLLVQGTGHGALLSQPKRSLVLRPSTPQPPKATAASHVVMPTRFPLPELSYLGGEPAIRRTIDSRARSRALLVNFWASWCLPCVAELKELTQRKPDLGAAGLEVLALSVDGLEGDDTTGPAAATRLMRKIGFPFEAGRATVELLEKLQRVQRFLFAQSPEFSVPLSLLLDRDGHLVAIYRGRVDLDRLLRDVKHLDATPNERRALAVPFGGRWLTPPGQIDLSLVAASFLDRFPTDALRYLELARQRHEVLDEATMSIPSRQRAALSRASIDLQIALILKRLGREDDALAHCRKSLSIDPDQAPLQLVAGNLLSAKGELQQAINAYEAAIRIDPQLAKAYSGLGLVHGALGNNTRAVEMFERVIELEADDAVAHMNLGTALQRLGRHFEAIAHYRRAVSLDPDQAVWHHKLSQALAGQGQLEHAIPHLQRFLQLRPNEPDWHYVLAGWLHHEGRDRAALAAYGEAHRLKPQWVAPLNDKAWILATHPDPRIRDEPEALGLAQQAAALTGHRVPEVLDSLAAAYAATGQYDRAVATAQRAIELASKNAKLADGVRGRLQLYKQGRPYREQSPQSEAPSN